MHGVHFGSPEDLRDLMPQLKENRHFAMDFWALTGTLSSREGGEFSDEDMLAMVVESVAGGAIPNTDGGLKKIERDLGSLLAGVDVQSPAERSAVENLSFPGTKMGSPSSYADGRNVAVRNAEVRETPPISAMNASATNESYPLLDETLLRLELNNLEMKRYLDKIDSRMSKIEPHLEGLGSKAPTETASAGTVSEAAEAPARVERFHRAGENTRLVLERDPLAPHGYFLGEREREWEDSPSVSIPLESYSEGGGHGRVAMFVVLLLAVAGGVFVQHRYGSVLREKFSAFSQQGYGATVREKFDVLAQQYRDGKAARDGAAAPKNSHSAAASQSAAGNQSSAAGSNTAANQNAATSQGVAANQSATGSQNAAANSNVTANKPQRQEPVRSSEGGPVVPPVATSAAVGTAPLVSKAIGRHGRYVARAAQTAAVEDAPGDEAGAVHVASAVMANNLVASRVPAYPEVAKRERIEGPVVVQASISKDGFVDRAHVIAGDPLLRSAALEAVHKWRYRPYLLNGRPVEVATTVTVDFKLNR